MISTYYSCLEGNARHSYGSLSTDLKRTQEHVKNMLPQFIGQLHGKYSHSTFYDSSLLKSVFLQNMTVISLKMNYYYFRITLPSVFVSRPPYWVPTVHKYLSSLVSTKNAFHRHLLSWQRLY